MGNLRYDMFVYRKALELACHDILSDIGLSPFITSDYDIQFKKVYNDYLNKAKKELFVNCRE